MVDWAESTKVLTKCSPTMIGGRLMVSSGMLAGGCRVRFSMHRPYCTLDGRRFGLRMIGTLLALSASSVYLLRLPDSLLGTLNMFYTITFDTLAFLILKRRATVLAL